MSDKEKSDSSNSIRSQESDSYSPPLSPLTSEEIKDFEIWPKFQVNQTEIRGVVLVLQQSFDPDKIKVALIKLQELFEHGGFFSTWMRWLGHVEHSKGWISKVHSVKVTGSRAPGRPKLTWEELTKRDRKTLGMSGINPQDCKAWKKALNTLTTKQTGLPSLDD